MSMMINLHPPQFEYSSKKYLIELFAVFLKNSFKQNMSEILKMTNIRISID